MLLSTADNAMELYHISGSSRPQFVGKGRKGKGGAASKEVQSVEPEKHAVLELQGHR